MADTGPKSIGETLFEPSPSEVITCLSGGAITIGEVVKLSAAMTATEVPTVVEGTADCIPYGVALKAASASGKYIPILKRGWVKLTAGGAITAGYNIKAGATGLAVVATIGIIGGTTAVLSHAATGNGVEGNIHLGIAETAASNNGDTFLAFINVG
jgi:hypothetical protein